MINQINHLNNLITIRENICEPIQFGLVCDPIGPFKIGNGFCPKLKPIVHKRYLVIHYDNLKSNGIRKFEFTFHSMIFSPFVSRYLH